MKKLLIIRGSHGRHKFLFDGLENLFENILVLELTRESILPKANEKIMPHDRNLFDIHFKRRFEVEQNVFELQVQEIQNNLHNEFLFNYPSMSSLNKNALVDCVADFCADICIVFGTELIKEPLISGLPENTFNIHLGLSPDYKGDATLFWPFYYMEPNHAGVTIHKLAATPDSGEILHQLVPNLVPGMSLHDVGAAAVVKAKEDLHSLLANFVAGHRFNLHRQRSVGKTFRGRDFRAEHLRVNYDLFSDRMVDAFLAGEITPRMPKLISAL